LFYSAYVAVDLFSRFILGWMIDDHQFVAQTCFAWHIILATLTVARRSRNVS